MIRARFVAAIAMVGLLGAGATAGADVKAQEKTQIKFEGMLGKMMGLFGGKRMKEGIVQTVSVKGDRKAVISQDSGTIVDLAEEKIYELNVKDRSYKVVTFAEMRQRLEEARRKAEEDARKAQAREKKDGEKEMEVDFDIKETGLKKEIAGYSCRQVVTTIGVHEKGKKLEQAGGILMTVDSWLAPSIAAMKEVADFELRYVKKLAADSTAADFAQALAMYPGMKDALAKFKKENVNLAGTPIQTVMTFQSVMTPEQAAQAKSRDDEKASSPGGAIGGLLGRFGRKKADDTKTKEPVEASAVTSGANRTTIMTSTTDVQSISTSVASEDLQVPAGFKQK